MGDWTQQPPPRSLGGRMRAAGRGAESMLAEEMDAEHLLAEHRAACEEIDRLRNLIRAALLDLEAEHAPQWASEEMKTKGKEPIGCNVCFPADGSWPCLSAMVADDLRAYDR